MEPAYQNALRKRSDAVRRLEEAQSEIARIDDFLKLYQEFGGSVDAFVGEVSGQNAEPSSANRERPTKGLTRAEGAPIIRELILRNGSPMQRSALLEALNENGTPVGGVDPLNNLGTMMWRMKDKFVNIEGSGYWPIDVDYEPANHAAVKPEDDHEDWMKDLV